MTLLLSPSQTIGPFSHEGWRWACDATASASGAVTVHGTLHDGDGVPVNDAMVEAWSPDAAAGEPDCLLPGFRRMATDDAGRFTLHLARPAPGQPAALVTIFARGLVLHQFTAIFLGDDAALAQSDFLRQIPAERRATLVATRAADGDGYTWDVHLQGAQETVFVDYA